MTAIQRRFATLVFSFTAAAAIAVPALASTPEDVTGVDRAIFDAPGVSCGETCQVALVPATRVSVVSGQLQVNETVGVNETLGRENNVTITSNGEGWTIQDPGGVAAGPGCVVPPAAGRSVQCDGVSTVDVSLGERNDELKFGPTPPRVPLSVRGGPGEDTISVSSGTPTIDAGDGWDTLTVTPADPTVTVRIDGGRDGDTITVRGGHPRISADGYNGSAINAQGDNDTISVTDAYPAIIHAGPGYRDVITTGRVLGLATGTNEIFTGPSDPNQWNYEGADTVQGGPGRDYIHSSNGNSLLSGDDVTGGGGVDTIDYSEVATGSAVNVSTYDNVANDGDCNHSGYTGTVDNIRSDVETVIGTSSTEFCTSRARPSIGASGDVIIGSAVNNQFPASGGRDYLDGGAGADILDGNEVVGGPGADTIAGSRIDAQEGVADIDRSIRCTGGGWVFLDAGDPAPTGPCPPQVYRSAPSPSAPPSRVDGVVPDLAGTGELDGDLLSWLP